MTLHALGRARQDLHNAIVDILDEGRVSAYPPGQDVGVQVWIDETRGGEQGTGIQADFPVHITSDGADRAQVAMVEDLTSRIWDACERGRLMRPVRWEPAQPITVAGRERRHAIVFVRLLIAARTLCLPDAPGVSPIPPDLTQE